MKTITFKDFEHNFDVFFEDVVNNKRHYKIVLENGEAVMLIPFEDYNCLLDIYNETMQEKTNYQDDVDNQFSE